MTRRTRLTAVVGLTASTLLLGCGRGGTPTQAISPDQFYTRGGGVASSPFSPIDQPGVLAGREAVPGAPAGRSGAETASSVVDSATGADPVTPSVNVVLNEPNTGPISQTVQEGVQPPMPVPAANGVARGNVDARGSGDVRGNSDVRGNGDAPGNGDTPRAPADGTYMTIGGVVAEVNGQPIYANRILKLQETILATKARELEPKQFSKFAKEQIDKQLRELISNELEFAAAQRNLNAEDRGLAEMLTMRWRGEQVTQAGGSVELARKRATAEGIDFEELVNQRYRFHMTQVYYQKKVIPQIQVSAADMRRYYGANLSSKFTEHEQAEFRLIKIDPKQRTGGRDEAFNVIKALRDRVTSGKEEFSAVASEVNDDPRLKKSGGDLGLGAIQRGAFALEDVENAVWKIQPGDVTDVIEAKGALYLAKVENRTAGKTLAFEDPAVQEKIRSTLRGEQFASRRDAVRGVLEKGAVIRVDDNMLATAVDMAMQRYPQWANQ